MCRATVAHWLSCDAGKDLAWGAALVQSYAGWPLKCRYGSEWALLSQLSSSHQAKPPDQSSCLSGRHPGPA